LFRQKIKLWQFGRAFKQKKFNKIEIFKILGFDNKDNGDGVHETDLQYVSSIRSFE